MILPLFLGQFVNRSEASVKMRFLCRFIACAFVQDKIQD